MGVMDTSWAVEWRPLPSASSRGRNSSHALPYPPHGASKQLEMVSFGVDPQWGGLLFSLCSRHEDAGAVMGAGGGILFPNILADPLAASSAATPAGAVDVVNIFSSGWLDVQSMSSVWTIIVETAKATGMVVLLGVGSLFFYRVYHSYWPRVRSRIHDLKVIGRSSSKSKRSASRGASRGASSSPVRSVSGSSSGAESDAENSDNEVAVVGAAHGRRLVVHDFETLAEDTEFTGMYFGPGAEPASMDGSHTSLPLAGPVVARNPSRDSRDSRDSRTAKATALRRLRRRSQQLSEMNRRWDRGAMSLDEQDARDADVSEGSRSPRTPPDERVAGRGSSWRAGPSLSSWRGQRGMRGLRGYSLPQHSNSTSASASASASGHGTPCSMRSTSSSSSLSPEYPPHRHRLNHNNGNINDSPSRRRSRRHQRAQLEQDEALLDDPREGILRRELHALRRDDSSDSLARRFMARDESFESLFACQQAGVAAAGRRRSLSRGPSMDSLCLGYARRLPRNESLDSLGFPRRANGSLTRGSSFDSTCSELSLDASLIAELAEDKENPTMACLEQIQREIDQLKSNCLSLDEEFETVRCNRNLPGMSSLLEVKGVAGEPGAGDEDESVLAERARARACFAGLYSLTRITSSPSLDLEGLSDWDGTATPPRLVQERALPATVSEEPLTSLEWDEDDMDMASYPGPADSITDLDLDLGAGACAANTSPRRDHDTAPKLERGQRRQLFLESSCPSLRDSDSMLTSSMATYELDGDSEVGDPVAPIPELDQEEPGLATADVPFGSVSREHLVLNLNDAESERGINSGILQDNQQQASSPASPDSWPFPEAALTHSSSSSGVSVLSRSLSGLSDAWCSSTAMTPATPASNSPSAIGQRINIQDYVRQEWQGDTKKAQTISKGYLEIPGLLGLNSIRVVRGDNYCAVRGTMYQALVRGLPLPSGRQAAGRCSQLLNDPAGHWLKAWNFAGRLPYAGDNVESGIRDCLLSIDSTIERLQSASDKEFALANMLNTDPWLDARLCEAAKLLMLVGALELYSASKRGDSLPLFAELLFARDSSSSPCDLMNNHLRHVGDTAGLEQAILEDGKVEMFLLGYSLGIRIRVVRPSAYGSQDYVCSYPDAEDIGVDLSDLVDNRKLVDLLAEDDRHYNVLLV